MYHLLYNAGIELYTSAVRLASNFNAKAKDWLEGRKNIWRDLEAIGLHDNIIWFHAASLGEAEQGLPIIEKLKGLHPGHFFLLSFFSPSGMNHFKRNDLVDHVCYLPADNPAKAKKFIQVIQPKLAVFIKYEVWANYMLALRQSNIPYIIAPAIFRENQFYFKWPHKDFFLPILRNSAAILTQDQNSVRLLKKHGIINCQMVGDSRFEKVIQNRETPFEDAQLASFTAPQITLIGGSTWPEDEKILKAVAAHFPELKMIIAPHDVSEANLVRLEREFGPFGCLRRSRLSSFQEAGENRIIILDSIGLLSKVYRFGNLAFIGGAFGKGIHNSLEAAAYGMPLFFGPKHGNFIEPSAMIEAGFAHEVLSFQQMLPHLENIINHPKELERQSQLSLQFVQSGTGATNKIVAVIQDLV